MVAVALATLAESHLLLQSCCVRATTFLHPSRLTVVAIVAFQYPSLKTLAVGVEAVARDIDDGCLPID